MKKQGKYERITAPVAAAKTSKQKAPKAKNMLLQTYFTGLICLVLSVGMFLGTSYAWFTSEVNNAANEIYVGTLKVGLYKENKDKLTGTAKPLDLADSTKGHKLFEDSIRWEPGYTNLETIKIVNEGDLAFQYVLTFTDGAIENANGVGLNDVAQYFDVCVYNHHNKQDPNPASFDEIIKDDNWDKVGTLADALNGKVVLRGNMVSVRKDGQDAAAINSGTTDGLNTTDEYTIALHMNENATSEVMGCKISLSVKLVAYQKAYETDDMGTVNYDSGISVATDAESLMKAPENSKHVILASDIALENNGVSLGKTTVDGKGYTITYTGDSRAVVTASGGKISNLKINGKEHGLALHVDNLLSDLVVTDCDLSGACSFDMSNASNGTVYFTDCKINDSLKPVGDTTLTNCEIRGNALNVSELGEGKTITLINCEYNSTKIEKAIITRNASSGGLHTENGIAVLDSTN